MTEPSVPTTVSPASERRLRDAMKRLFAGEAIRTDGRLTKNNLCAEANVSRATMNRADRVLAEWNAVVTSSRPRDKQTTLRAKETAELQNAVRELRQEVRTLRDQLTAAGTVIAGLHQENLGLLDEAPSATVSPLTRSTRRQRRT